MAKTRTPGITVLADGRLFIDKRYLGVRIGLRVGAITQEQAEQRLRVEMARIECSEPDYYDIIGDDDGVFGCMSLLGCHDVVPKELPLATQIAFMRRKMVKMAWSKWLPYL